MESDDDYESSSFINNEPSPSPKHCRLKRLRKSAIEPNQSEAIESVSELPGLPKVDFANLEALESSDIKAFGHDSSPRSLELEDALDNGDDDCRKQKELTSCYDDTDNTCVDINRKESKSDSEFEKGSGGDDDGYDDSSSKKEKELRSCVDDTRVDAELKANETDLKFEESFDDDDDDVEKKLKTYRKETKRALHFDDDVSENLEATDVKIRVDEVNEFVEDVANEKKRKKKKRTESSGEESKAISVKRMAKERKAHLEQLHAESQRLLRETRGVSFKAVPLVQKPISSILEKIRQRKLEVSKKFSQLDDNVSDKEDDGCVKQDVMDHLKSVETAGGDLSESGKEDKVSSVSNADLEPDGVGMDLPDASIKRKRHDNACSQMALDEESTPVLRAPVDDTQELFGSQTSDGKESENEEPSENTSSHEEEMQPSLLAMKLKFDSALDDDISDEEENDKENVAPQFQLHSSPTGDPVKAFVDVEAEEEDDSDNDRMRFGDDDEEEDDDDIEELNKMIATGYKERPIDLETRNELHQKWLEEKDAAGTDDLLRRLNVTSKLRDASLLDDVEEEEEEEGEDQDQDDVEMNNDAEEDLERPRVGRIDSKTAKELIAQMFTDKDDNYISSDDEEIEKIVVRERLRNKAGDKGKLVSPLEDEDSSEVFGLIKKLNTVPEVRKKAKTTSCFDSMLTGGNSNSSSKSSFLSRASSHTFSSSSKQGRSSGARSFIFGRDDSNSRSSISVSEDISDTTTSREIQTKKVTTKYSSSQVQARSSTQTTKLVTETNSTTSFFEILKNAAVQSSVKKQIHEVEISQSAFAAFKIPKKKPVNPRV
ncbi:uncharacterized protein [Rutidosis leptorrhynchoides]|uniref:uncharacterized protein n=1 Tax=Rutidosis leptorrhynchoides TaxID=125765 RepID=UPI003A9A21C9